MHILVCSKSMVPDMVSDHNVTHIISLLDPRDSLPLTSQITSCERLHLVFEDVLDETDKNAPTREQVQTLLSWTKNLPRDAVVLIHCFAGISRSTAAAIGILAQETKNIEKSIEIIKSQRPNLCPNPVISKFADDILGFNGQLHDECEKVANFRILTLLA